MTPITFAISPCPNDTFVFYAWVENKISSSPPLTLKMADIEELNRWALAKRYPFIKASIALLPLLSQDYFLLPVGTALGYGCGPKIISLTPFSVQELPGKKILVPGQHTTAHSLLNSLFPHCTQKVFCSYDSIFNRLKHGEADCGLIIHESRFTFQSEGFYEIVDLGEKWTEKTALPVPLGGYFALKSLPKETINSAIQNLQASLNYSWKAPHETFPYMLKWSQEKDPLIVKSHVDLYVSNETFSLSATGRKAIEKLTSHPLTQVLYEDETLNLCTTL